MVKLPPNPLPPPKLDRDLFPNAHTVAKIKVDRQFRGRHDFEFFTVTVDDKAVRVWKGDYVREELRILASEIRDGKLDELVNAMLKAKGIMLAGKLSDL